MSTSAGWDGVLDGIINEEDCKKPDNEIGYPGNCGSSTVGIAYLLAYLVISFLIVINMYIAVILENYSQVSDMLFRRNDGLLTIVYCDRRPPKTYKRVLQMTTMTCTMKSGSSSTRMARSTFATTSCPIFWTCWSHRCRSTNLTNIKSFPWTFQYAKET